MKFRRDRAAPVALAALAVGLLTFADGGTDPGPVGLAVVGLAVAFAARLAYARNPLEGVGRTAALAVMALAALAAWSAASMQWSGAPDRAVTGALRPLLYALAVALIAAFPAGASRARWVASAVMWTLAVVVVAALAARLLPDLISTPQRLEDGQRLGWPISYWNALGAVAAGLIVLAVGATTDQARRPRARILAAGLVPLGASALIFTGSRGALAGLIVALVVLAVAARPRLALAATPALLAGAGLAGWATATSGGLLDTSWRTAGPDASRLLALLAMAVLLAVALRAAAVPVLDQRLTGWDRRQWSRRATVASALISVGAILAAAALAHAPARFSAAASAFTAAPAMPSGDDSRMLSLNGNGRIKTWRAALTMNAEEPLTGTGAGTFVVEWNRLRSGSSTRGTAHSLYLQTLGELGIVGVVLLAAALLALALGLWRSIRREDRHPAAVAGALLAGWCVHAGVDWMWEASGVTVAVLFVAAAALPGPRVQPGAEADRRDDRAAWWRPIAVIALVAVAIVPARFAISQSRTGTAVRAADRGDCATALPAAQGASRMFPRPPAMLIAAYCLARADQTSAALLEIREARDRDPRNWVYPYAEGVLAALEGGDPQPALREAVRLDPTGDWARFAQTSLASDRPGVRRGRAGDLPFPTHAE